MTSSFDFFVLQPEVVTHPEVVCGLFVVLNGLVQLGHVTLVDFGDALEKSVRVE
jgi:hypothetical protein